MAENKLVIFDNDGTIMNSAPGITKCVQSALVRLGYPEPPAKELEVFIGPPLYEEFRAYAGMGHEEALQAVEYYRERYGTVGKFEADVYPGIPELFEKLQNAGCQIAVATSKPGIFTRQILEHFGLMHYIGYLAAPELTDTKSKKPELITSVLKWAGRLEDRENVYMVGDRHYDMDGAVRTGITGIGVTYGFGSREELISTGASVTVGSAAELGDYLLGT